MAAGLLEAAAEFRAALSAFDAALVSGADCAVLVEQLARIRKACAAAEARAAARAAACRAHTERGYRDAADWLARAGGSSKGEARAALGVAGAADRCPATAQALAAGELSLRQAEIITSTEAACPGSESELVALARRSDLASLRDEGRRRRLAAADPEDLHRRQHQARSVRHWLDELGMVRLEASLPPEVGLPIVRRLDAGCDRIRRAAGLDKHPEPRSASCADALVALLNGTGAGKATAADLVIVCDLDAWRRGSASDGEVCHVVGGGPVPVAVARALGRDAFVKAVIRDGRRIDTVAHFGRHIPAELRTALELGPELEGVVCVEPGCGRRHGLEWDHLDPVANGGVTSFDNLAPRCWPHHRAKTDDDRAAGLLGGGALDNRGPP